jgi:hypothetical protein
MRLTVDCAGLTQPALDTVGALARMQLNAWRAGSHVELANAGPGLLELLDLAGLAEVLLGEGQRQPEQREQARGVEEEGELDDPSVL